MSTSTGGVERRSPRPPDRFVIAGKVLIVLSVVGASTILLGWLLDARRLAAPIEGGHALKVNAAIAFVAVGIALLLDPARPALRLARRALAVVPVAIGSAVLVLDATNRTSSIDELLLVDRWAVPGHPPGRTAALVAIVLLVFGVALLVWEQLQRTRDVLVAVATTLSVIPLLGYVFHVEAFYAIGHSYAVPVEASILATMLAMGALFATPPSALGAWLFGTSSSMRALTLGAITLAVVLPILGGLAFHALEVRGVDGAAAAWMITMVATAWALAAVLVATGTIRRLDARFRTLLDTIPEGVFETTYDGRLVLASEPLAHLLGYGDVRELLADADDVSRFWVDPAERGDLLAGLDAGATSGRRDVRLHRRDGSMFVGELSFNVVPARAGGQTGLRGTIRDVTDVRALEADATRADERFRLAFEVGPLGRAMLDLSDEPVRFVAVNEHLAEMLGYTVDELMSVPPESLAPPDGLPAEWNMLADALRGVGTIDFDTHRLHRDGTAVPVHVTGDVVHADDGRSSYGMFAVEDLRPRLAAERRIDRSQRALTHFVENAPAAVYLLDDECRFTLVNSELERILGLPRDEVLGRARTELPVHQSSAAEHRRNDILVMHAASPQTVDERLVVDGETRHYLSTRFPLIDGQGKVFGVGGVSTDITELRVLRGEADRAWAETTHRLAKAIEFRDRETGAHIDRMAAFCELIASNLPDAPVDPERLRVASMLHDAGKIAIPDSILLKPDTLTAAERTVMERHAALGYDLLRGTGNADLDLAASIAHTHHERWDGTGYPRGLRGTDIPLEGRIAAIADVFDAITSDRVYRRGVSVAAAVEILEDGSGTAFDPRLLAIFLEHLDEAVALGRAYDDAQPRALVDQAPTAW